MEGFSKDILFKMNEFSKEALFNMKGSSKEYRSKAKGFRTDFYFLSLFSKEILYKSKDVVRISRLKRNDLVRKSFTT